MISGLGSAAVPGRVAGRVSLRFVGRKARVLAKVLVVFLAVAASWLPAVVLNNMMGYVPGAFVTFGIAFSGLYLLALRRNFDYAQAVRVSQCTRGERVDFVLRMRNKSFLVFPRIEMVFFQSDLFGNDDRVETGEAMLAPFAVKDFTFSMRFDHIGVCSAGLRRVVLHDLIGLFSFTYENDDVQRIEVLPELRELSGIAFSSESPTQNANAIKTVLDEGMDYAMVREYRWGDPIKSIHWKLSARIGEYVTRVYESNADPGLTTIVDLHVSVSEPAVAMQLYDAVIESALSLSDLALRQGLSSTLRYVDEAGDHVSLEGRANDEAARALVRMLKPDSAEYAGSACELLREEVESQFSQSNVALCTAALDDGLVEALVKAKGRRKNPILLLAVPSGQAPEERRELLRPLKRLDAAHIEYFVLASADDLAGEGIAP